MKIGELPFHERPIGPLLGFSATRTALDTSYAGYGWCRAEAICLDDGRSRHRLARPLLLALHSADDAPAQAHDVLLEFALTNEPDAPTVSAALATFLDVWLPRLPADGPIVLALCNPHRATLSYPRAAGGRAVHYALGDVDAWLDEHDPTPRLHASAWRLLDPETA